MPEHAYLPPVLERGRAWGFALNLYALRSARNWGIGDFGDLLRFVRWSAEIGADIVGVNPLHALHYVEPEAASPYSPTSRYFLSPLYIDVEAVPEYASPVAAAVALRERIASEPFARTLAELRATPHVAYARVARAKWSALGALYEIFRADRGERQRAFRAFVARGGERLERFAIYEALTERFSTDEGRVRGWLTWPEQFRDPAGDAVRTWAAQTRRRVEYFKYLQWLASDQLALSAEAARELSIGLYLDVAVGVDVNSADVWSDLSAYVLDETIGAPPDPLGPQGQNWGLPPLDPAAMLRERGAAFSELLSANMAYAGALRLDHVMALLRLFRIPRGKSPADGAYVAYPFDELIGFARVESERRHCLIVGEDLGNVPDGFRDRMERERIFSYRLLLFEREHDGRFRPPAAYPALSLATGTTHDVPTLLGWVIGRDLEVRQGIGILSPEAASEGRAARRIDASQLLEALASEGELDGETFHALHATLDEGSHEVARFDALTRAAYRFLAKTPARLVLVQLDDAAGELEQINLPGTFTEYPNWRRKSGLDLDGIARDERIAALVADVRTRVKGGSST
jgi:(1->4)-alpha-D-glucan 1-alpha-D-glucosylmutase